MVLNAVPPPSWVVNGLTSFEPVLEARGQFGQNGAIARVVRMSRRAQYHNMSTYKHRIPNTMLELSRRKWFYIKYDNWGAIHVQVFSPSSINMTFALKLFVSGQREKA